MKPAHLSDKAKEHEVIFAAGLLSRSEEKFQQGLRSRKKHMNYRDWCKFRRAFGDDFLVSTYSGGTYCVVTTPNAQYGYLTEEMETADSLLQHHQKEARPFVTEIEGDRMTHYKGTDLASIAHETEDPQPGVASLTKERLIGLKGECWADRNTGCIGMAVPPMGAHSDAIQWEIMAVTPGDGRTPAWVDLVAGDFRIRINPDICQPPFWRLSDCVWMATGLWETLPTGECWAKLSLPPEPHPHSQEFVFQKTVLSDGVECVIIDTFERCQKHCKAACVKDGQHRTKA
jgi:hypothetical protein